MSENLFGLTVAADKGLDDLQCQRLLSENRRYQEVMLQYRCALKALECRWRYNSVQSLWTSGQALSIPSAIRKTCQ